MNERRTFKEMLPRLGEKGGDVYDTGLRVVVPDKGSPLKAERFGGRVEFFKLRDFHRWLDKYTLAGS
jgi:ribose transport system substrate-binding protein